MKIVIPKYVKQVIDTLEKNGFEAFVVGGAVRDAMLGQVPDDWDVATNAVAQEIKKLFVRHFDTGIKHGTITVLTDDNPVEVTTYRIDGIYKDNRRPENVDFTTDIKEDLKRRDFTVNAMAYNEKTGLVDLYGGAKDLKNKIIRCVGDADTRFCEDALRIMRAIRFAIRLGFEIEENTFKAIDRNKNLLKNISAERIQVEVLKILEENDLHLLFNSGVAGIILPEVDFKTINLNVPEDKELRLSALLYWVSDAKGVFTRLKFDNKTKNNVIKIIQCARENFECSPYSVKKMLNKYGEEIFEKALVLKKAYGKSSDEEKMIFNSVKAEPYSIKHLAITGDDIISSGIESVNIGKVLDKLLDMVIKNPNLNEKEKLKEFILEIK